MQWTSEIPGSLPKRTERPGGVVDRAEFIALASPPCEECGTSIHRVESPWHLDEDGNWRLGPSFMVCGKGHRVLVKPLL
jgi:hypothetical protein